MNISIPDRLYKFLALIGLFLIGYSFYYMDFAEQKYFSEIDKHREIRDSVLLAQMQIDNEKDDLIRISDFLSTKYSVENPLLISDSTLVFSRVLNGPKNNLIVSDSIETLWKSYKKHKFQLNLLTKKLTFSQKYLDEEENLKKNYFSNYIEIRDIGFTLLFLGVLMWVMDIPSINREKNIIKQKEKLYSFCQSCGLEFNSMLKYGTNKNKSDNYAFCKDCFRKGKFTNPNLTKEEFITNSLNIKKNKNWLSKKILKSRLSRLERWRDYHL
ncbi:zinc ribbon domain-containing protein [Arenibacter palladensis]|uniref:zinc ribbon domain-containing protein n=1 Tax=Arenibacter palladensis TaxID=237373 RepID=UPI0026E246AF|nr:zinc ribbon domain-containing protein [Arenibacter palladensis]MDO6602794.1 zinc ribbon domain-containing protein [Arenibacter palladensis]